MHPPADPAELLLDIERRCQRHAAALPQPTRPERTIDTGIGFLLAGLEMVAAMSEISEILAVPRLSKVPGVKPWVCGIANLRGRLLPIYDIDLLCGHERDRTVQQREQRVLVTECSGQYSGFMVSKIFGMKPMDPDRFESSTPAAPSALSSCMDGFYRNGEQMWLRLSPRRLTAAPALQQLAR